MLRDMIGNKSTDELLSEFYTLIDDMKTLGWKELRPWSEFFATFKAPDFTQKILEERIITNFLYYRSNYVILMLGILILQILFSPIILLSFLLVFGVITYLCHYHKTTLKVGDYKIDAMGKQYLALGISILILIITGTITSLMWTLVYGLILCGLHVVFRPRNVSSKANKVYEEMKLNGVDNIFQFITSVKVNSSSGSDSKKSEDPEAPAPVDHDPDHNYYQEGKVNSAGNMRKRTGAST